MKLNNANTQLGVTFRVMEFTDAETLSLAQDPVKLTRITDCMNADRRQKVALVDARRELSLRIGDGHTPEDEDKRSFGGLGFSRLTREEKKDGKVVTVPDETDNEHIKRFIAALVAGTFTAEGWTLPSGDDNAKEAAAFVFLQKIANECGDEENDGLPCYILDLEKTVRTGTGGLIPKWATEQASTVLAKKGKKSAKECAEMFTTGFTTIDGIAIDPFVFADFQQKAHKDASPEEKESIHQSNVKNLAKAFVIVDKQKRAKQTSEFC